MLSRRIFVVCSASVLAVALTVSATSASATGTHDSKNRDNGQQVEKKSDGKKHSKDDKTKGEKAKDNKTKPTTASTVKAAASTTCEQLKAVEIPVTTHAKGDKGTTKVLLQKDVAAALVGKTAKITFTGENNGSVRKGSDLLVKSGDKVITLSDVEATAGKVTKGSGTLVLAKTMSIELKFGEDGKFSGGGTLKAEINCTPAVAATVAPKPTTAATVKPTVAPKPTTAPTVAPKPTTAPTVAATTPATAAPQVLSETVTQPTLARTGVESKAIFGLGLLLFLIGTAIMVTRRAMRQQAA